MSAIYEKLGAPPYLIPILWLAGPVTSILVRPLVGWSSDHIWTRLGRRRPFLLVGSIFACIALFLIPSSTTLWMAVALLWLQTSSIHTTSEPFRPLVADNLGEEQRTTGFVMQSFFIGIGATCANALPYILRTLGVEGEAASGIPLTVIYAFRIVAVFFLLTVLWTVVTSKEYPPDDLEAFRREAAQHGWRAGEFFEAIRQIPPTMKKLAPVQIFTWLGFFCIWMFYVPTVARHIFGATEPQSPLYNRGIEWGGVCFAVYAITSFVVALLLSRVTGTSNRKLVHAVALVCGGSGLLSTYFIRDPYILLLTMVGVGFAWASSHSLPFAIVSSAIPPARMGFYMGVFSFFTAAPGIFASLTFRPLVRYAFDNNPLYVVMLGGACMLIASLLLLRVRDIAAEETSLTVEPHVRSRDAFVIPEAVKQGQGIGLMNKRF